MALWMPTLAKAAPPLQEATPTESPTPTPTFTETMAGTLEATVSPTVVGPTPPTLTPSPGFTSTATITLSPTPTETLEPLPEITLLFPVFTPTSTSTPTPEPAILEATLAAETAAQRQPLPPDVLWVGFVIVLLWLLLAGFLIAFLRHFGG